MHTPGGVLHDFAYFPDVTSQQYEQLLHDYLSIGVLYMSINLRQFDISYQFVEQTIEHRKHRASIISRPYMLHRITNMRNRIHNRK